MEGGSGETSSLRQPGRMEVGRGRDRRRGLDGGESTPSLWSSLAVGWPLIGRSEELALTSTLLGRRTGGGCAGRSAWRGQDASRARDP